MKSILYTTECPFGNKAEYTLNGLVVPEILDDGRSFVCKTTKDLGLVYNTEYVMTVKRRFFSVYDDGTWEVEDWNKKLSLKLFEHSMKTVLGKGSYTYILRHSGAL